MARRLSKMIPERRGGRQPVAKHFDDLLHEIVGRLGQIERLLLKMNLRSKQKGRVDMARWDAMIAAVEKVRGRDASMQEAFRQLNAKVEELKGNMNDEEDQKQVDQFATELSAFAERLPQATAANPAPGETGGTPTGGDTGTGGQPGGGRSAGGQTE